MGDLRGMFGIDSDRRVVHISDFYDSVHPDDRSRVAQAVAHAPHTRYELAWWAAVSLSAGFCEELIFRGYLIWVLRPLLGLWGAAAFSLVVFAVAHAYHGVAGALATGVVGGLLTLVVLIFGSLWPAVAIHLLIDLQQGFAAWLVLQKQPHPVPSSTCVCPGTAAELIRR